MLTIFSSPAELRDIAAKLQYQLENSNDRPLVETRYGNIRVAPGVLTKPVEKIEVYDYIYDEGALRQVSEIHPDKFRFFYDGYKLKPACRVLVPRTIQLTELLPGQKFFFRDKWLQLAYLKEDALYVLGDLLPYYVKPEHRCVLESDHANAKA